MISWPQAATAEQTAGYSLALGEKNTRFSVQVDKGKVISQDPAPGTAVDRDSLVSLVVSDGVPPEGTVLMPDWKGKTAAEATRWAETHQCRARVAPQVNDSVAPDTVISQNNASLCG